MAITNAARTIELRPLTPTFGAEVFGVDLNSPIDDDTLGAVKAGLDIWKVLVFRENRIDHAAQIALSRRLGTPVFPHTHDDGEPAPGYPSAVIDEGFPELYRVDNKWQKSSPKSDSTTKSEYENSFRSAHADSTAGVNPPAYSILRAEVVPEAGGDTTYFDNVAAYAELSAPVRAFVDTLWARHGFTPFGNYPGEYRLTRHPVVRVIPETGERSLFVGPVFTQDIIDVSITESRWILEHLYAHITRPGFAVRVRWDPATVVVSDNRRTSHIGPQDIGPETDRVLHLSMIGGDRPVGTDGRESEIIEGRPDPPRRPPAGVSDPTLGPIGHR